MKNNSILEFLKGKKILVFGLGHQGGGVGDLQFLIKHGFDVRGTDLTLLDLPYVRAPLTLGRHDEADITWADIIIKNPAVPEDSPYIVKAHEQGKLVTSSIALFVKYSPIKTIGITGTRGKSTTTALITQVLEAVYPGQILSGGNIPGTSPLSLFDQLDNKIYAVLELSSFQLHSFHALSVSPNYSLLTNIYPDHQNRYPNMEEYQKDKQAIRLYQKEGDFYVEYPDEHLVADWESPLPGVHNRQNIAGMWSIVSKLNVPETVAREVVRKFKGLPFRQEVVAVKKGITFVNDTTATTPVALRFALLAQQKPTILICGGASKGLPVEPALEEIGSNKLLKNIILLGSKDIREFTDPITKLAPKYLGMVDSLKEAIDLALLHAEPGDTVLLSPGFSSFDLFQNEFDRGRQFNDLVASL